MKRGILIIAGIAGIALLLAFPLRDTVYDVVIVPVAYILWILGLLYHAADQSVWWIIVILVALILLGRSLLPNAKPVGGKKIAAKPVVGQVESLAGSVQKSERGQYFKWLIANRLGKVAYQILSQREPGKTRSVFDPLIGLDWKPDEDLRSYLESGLHDSFANFSHNNGLFSRPAKTPLDHNVDQAVEFLEKHVKN